jgi:hypothetical protein
LNPEKTMTYELLKKNVGKLNIFYDFYSKKALEALSSSKIKKAINQIVRLEK